MSFAPDNVGAMRASSGGRTISSKSLVYLFFFCPFASSTMYKQARMLT